MANKKPFDLSGPFAAAFASPLADDLRRARQAFARKRVNQISIHYEQTSNPLFAWEAYHLCARYGFDTPNWVDEYLASVAEALLELGKSKPDRVPDAVYDALGMKGKPSPWTVSGLVERDLDLAIKVSERREELGSLEKAVASVAEDPKIGAERTTIQSAYKKYCKLLDLPL